MTKSQNPNLHFRDDVSGLKLRRDRDLNRIFESQKFRMIVVHVFDVHNHLELVFGFQIKVIYENVYCIKGVYLLSIFFFFSFRLALGFLNYKVSVS